VELTRAYRTEFAPDEEEQLRLLYQHAGVARFAYNLGLRWKLNVMQYNQLPHEHVKLPTEVNLHRELNLLKKTKFQWMYDSSKCAPQNLTEGQSCSRTLLKLARLRISSQVSPSVL
jgi:putative transposase